MLWLRHRRESRSRRNLKKKKLLLFSLELQKSHFSFSSQFSRLRRRESLPTLNSWYSVLRASFPSCEKGFIFLERHIHLQGSKCGREQSSSEIVKEFGDASSSASEWWALGFSVLSRKRKFYSHSHFHFLFSRFGHRRFTSLSPLESWAVSRQAGKISSASFFSRNWRRKCLVFLSPDTIVWPFVKVWCGWGFTNIVT